MYLKKNGSRLYHFLQGSRPHKLTSVVLSLLLLLIMVDMVPQRVWDPIYFNSLDGLPIWGLIIMGISVIALDYVFKSIIFYKKNWSNGIYVKLSPRHDNHLEHEFGDAIFINSNSGVAVLSVYTCRENVTLSIELPDPLQAQPMTDSEIFEFHPSENKVVINKKEGSTAEPVIFRLKISVTGDFRGHTLSEMKVHDREMDKQVASALVRMSLS